MLQELKVCLPTISIVYYDNTGVTYLCANPVFHSKIKRIVIDFHFVYDKVQNGELQVSLVFSEDQLVNVFSKPLLHQ